MYRGTVHVMQRKAYIQRPDGIIFTEYIDNHYYTDDRMSAM